MPLSSRTCELSTDDAYAEVLTLSAEVSPVRISPSQGIGPESSKGIGAGSGISSPDSFAKLDPDSFWLKTSGGFCQLIMGGASERFCETWPRSGMMLNGSCFPLPMLEHPTKENESGLWPTPSASQARSEGMITQMREKVEAGEITREEAERMIGGSQTPARMTEWPTPAARDFRGHGSEEGYHRRRGKGHRQGLNEEVMWRTPKATDGPNGGPNARDSSGGLHLSAQAAQWPTPTVSQDHKLVRPLAPSGANGTHGTMLVGALGQTNPELIGGQLNPMWVEWLMGWPLGWTVLDAPATGWFRNRPRKLGKK